MNDMALDPKVQSQRKVSRIQLKFGLKLMDLRYEKQPALGRIKKNFLKRQVDAINEREHPMNSVLKKLDDNETERWSAQLRNPHLNQDKISNLKVAVVGCGGIGTNAILNLLLAGVSDFHLVDNDRVEVSNLNRQSLYDYEDLGKLKVVQSRKRILQINPEARLHTHEGEIHYPIDQNVLRMKEKHYPEDVSSLDGIIKKSDYIINAVDHFGSPYLINDLCIKNEKPFLWGGIYYHLGEVYFFEPCKNAPCLRCIFGQNHILDQNRFLRFRVKDTKKGHGSSLGICAVAAGNIMASLLINDACGVNRKKSGTYFIFDALDIKIHEISLKKDQSCCCSKPPPI